MRAGRWMGAAFGALGLAILPGALQLVPAVHGLDRAAAHGVAEEASLDRVTRPPVSSMAAPTTLPAPVVTAGPVLPPDDAPIISPPADLKGELAPAVPAPKPFAAASRAPARAGEVFALVVGIDDYPGSEYDLDAAVADADTVEAALRGFGVPAGNRVVLRDGQARRGQLVAAIRALVDRAGPGSTAVFAFAGHARKVDDNSEVLVAADGETVSDRELAELLAPLQAERTWLLLATCYAGGFTEALGRGRILTGAADADSLAYESRSLNGSYLVHHMVREGWLQGRSGPSVQEAFAYADARIAQQYGDRRPVEYDESGQRLRLGPGDPAHPSQPGGQDGSGTPTQDGPPPTSPTTTAPERRCSFLVVCRRS